MVMKMNKKEFIEKLSKELNCDIDYSRKINDLLEENFFIGKRNKEKTINTFMYGLNITKEEAENIYNVSMKIITTGIKNKIIHPFKDKDNTN